jgi:hypothetical protein
MRPPHTSVLTSVAAVSSTDVWTVGYVNLPGRRPYVPLIKHFDGVSWRTVPSFSGTGQLTSVDAVATDDVWAVGHARHARNTILVLHWDGVSWQRTATPHYPDEGYLYNVDVIAPDRVLATGYYYSGECPCYPIRMVWNGTEWSVATGKLALLSDLSVLSPRDIWGVGNRTSDWQSDEVAFHWNGKRWQNMHPPRSIGRYLVEAIADDDVWQAGGPNADSLLEHWDGHTWTHVDDAADADIRELSSSGADDVWAAGYNSRQGLLEHWDGQEWSSVANPGTPLSGSQLNGVLVISRTDAWAVGSYRAGLNTHKILMHWDGHTWSLYGTHR